MKISVIIPAYNEEKFLPLTLKALLKQKEKPNEIIVIDNNSTDKTAHIAKKFNCRVIKETKQGLTFARNKGFDSAKYEILARIDADTIPPPNWLTSLKEYLKKNPSTQALTGPVLFYDLPIKSTFPVKLYLNFSYKLSNTYYLLGPNMVITKTAWNLVRDSICLDDSKVHEDVDLSLHLKQKNIKVHINPEFINYISARRIKSNPLSFFVEYPIRLIRMLKDHK